MNHRFALTGAAIVTPDEVLEGSALIVAGDRIEAIVSADDFEPGLDQIILDGGFLTAGFIDIQVNGGGGVLFNDDVSIDGIAEIAAAHARFGTTCLLPTLISDTPETIARAIDAVDAAIAQGTPGIAGIHVEGPFLNPEKHGIHDPRRIARLDEAGIQLLTRPGRGIRLVTLAPERATPGTIAALRGAGLIVCAGHSMASYAETRRALDEGLSGFTHLFNAMTQFGAREPGMVGAALEDRRSRFGLIADGHHVHPAAMRVALRARGIEGVMLVTDAMPPVGATDRTFRLGETVVETIDGALRGPDGTLAGSNLDMGAAFRNAVRILGLPLPDAARLASANAAAFLGLEGERGRLARGLAADIVHLTADLAVKQVWIGGRSID